MEPEWQRVWVRTKFAIVLEQQQGCLLEGKIGRGFRIKWKAANIQNPEKILLKQLSNPTICELQIGNTVVIQEMPRN